MVDTAGLLALKDWNPEPNWNLDTAVDLIYECIHINIAQYYLQFLFTTLLSLLLTIIKQNLTRCSTDVVCCGLFAVLCPNLLSPRVC